MHHLANYTDPQLFDLQTFKKSLESNKSTISVFREALARGNKLLIERFKRHLNATKSVAQRTWLVDQVILHAWKLCPQRNTDDIALVAVGGYGRCELLPASDIDLMILLEHPLDEATKACIESFIVFLWDIKLEVGHSVRTLQECREEAITDITVVSNLLEARLIIGSKKLFNQMQEVVAPDQMWPTEKFFAAKTKEQEQRYHKYHDTAYNLEPNIKEGPGGLRDIHTVAWVAKRHFGANTLYDLVQHGFLTEEEYDTIISGQEFLWKIRSLLHILAKRREDRLLFDYQRSIAETFGYQDDENRLGVEKFMRQYYRTVMELNSLNEMLLQLFEEVILYSDLSSTVYPLNKRFQIRNDLIEVTHEKVFINYPFALLEIFLLMQQNPRIKGIRASTIRLIRQHRWLFDSAFHKDLRARSLFFEIFRQPQGLTHALQRMNRYGILAAYIPAFGQIVGQMQYDLFHVYTVDQHTVFVVSNLRCFSLPEREHEFPLCSKIMKMLPKPELLYLAGLFHDIAKGRGGDHSELGESEALEFCQIHGLSDQDARFVAWLVRHHLIMSTTAQRQDISDPDVINAFAKRIQELTHLDYLYLLTVADIRATNSNLWNNWKDTLLADLYNKTRYVLEHGPQHSSDKRFHIKHIQTEAFNLLNDDEIDKDTVLALWKDLGDDYFLYSSPEDIARETHAILDYVDHSVPLVLERHGKQGSTEIITIHDDHDYSFAKTTHYLEHQGLTVVDAYVIPTQRKYVIAGYTLLEENGIKINSQARVADILQGLEQALRQDRNNFCPINRYIPRQQKHFSIPTRITFTQDYINDHTLLEVITTDRPGVLSRIAQAFAMCEARLKKAKIATFGSRVEDIFFITDQHSHALQSAQQLDCLREHLFSLLDTDVPKTQK